LFIDCIDNFIIVIKPSIDDILDFTNPSKDA